MSISIQIIQKVHSFPPVVVKNPKNTIAVCLKILIESTTPSITSKRMLYESPHRITDINCLRITLSSNSKDLRLQMKTIKFNNIVLMQNHDYALLQRCLAIRIHNPENNVNPQQWFPQLTIQINKLTTPKKKKKNQKNYPSEVVEMESSLLHKIRPSIKLIPPIKSLNPRPKSLSSSPSSENTLLSVLSK